MSQKTNLNISPYYDDFNEDNNFYKVLFKPGRPVQARELTTLQSILFSKDIRHSFRHSSYLILRTVDWSKIKRSDFWYCFNN